MRLKKGQHSSCCDLAYSRSLTPFGQEGLPKAMRGRATPHMSQWITIEDAILVSASDMASHSTFALRPVKTWQLAKLQKQSCQAWS